ncbi:GIY-YIG nuclease family protein [Algibacter sp. R77976]|uniref:GIY-YIG nuclease family protein n=1 Tax=Algibacter sp. R77976 TaxID=3093873 RepID=UPI0037C66CDE
MKKGLNKKTYYVYGLIDPRNNQYFYIGKGKGKRYLSHLKPNKLDFNSSKLNRIKEIQNSGFQVKFDILFPYLEEETAFELERLIIYKLGREVLNEGILTNLTPGGNWKPKDPMFYSKDFNTDFDLIKLDFVAQQKFQEIPNLSQFNYLNTPNKEQKIYKYDYKGNFELENSLDDFCSNGLRGFEINMLKALRENDFPIYSGGIYSKYFFENIYISDKIPYSKFDIIDESFNLEFDKKYNISQKFNLDCTIEGVLRNRVERNKNIITMTSYYPSGIKKSFNKTKDGKLFELACEWYENGNLSVRQIIKDNSSEYASFYKNGQKQTEIITQNEKETYTSWFENGNKESELIHGTGYIYYDELGNKIRVEAINEGREFLSYLKESEDDFEVKLKEKEDAELDWLKYVNEMNKLNE